MPTGSKKTLSDGSYRPLWWKHIALRLGAPRSLRSYLVLFAAALWLPLLLLAGVSLSRMATLEREQLELRIQSVSRDLTRMIDRELDHMIATLQTLASSRGQLAGPTRGASSRGQLAGPARGDWRPRTSLSFSIALRRRSPMGARPSFCSTETSTRS